MDESFQRLFSRAEPQVLSMNVQAALGSPRVPQRSQFSQLTRHFLERFFNHETASPDGDAKTRLIQIAFATSLPPFLIAIYLWPVYHPITGWPPGQPHSGEPPTYWLQVDHHLFFILYSFVVLGIAAVFEWDLFFPDLLDLLVLGSLPIPARRAFAARVVAIALLIAAFLFDTNLLSSFVLPMALDPPNLLRFLAGHLLAVTAAGLFSALSILASQSIFLCLFGERLFRKLTLILQGSAITLLVMLMLLFPVLSSVVPSLLQSGSLATRCFPPFWFLGMDQLLLEGPHTMPIYASLAKTGLYALGLAAGTAVLTYPLAYLRRMHQLIEGTGARRTSHALLRPVAAALHATILRRHLHRAIFHFIGQTLQRVPRYRIYLVLYGGVGLSVVAAGVLRLTVIHQQIKLGVSPDGVRVALAIVIFWVVAGLRITLCSSGNQRGRWVFRIVHGHPPDEPVLLEELRASWLWVLLATSLIASIAGFILSSIAPPELHSGSSLVAQALVAASMCLLLTDIFLLNITTLPFSGEEPGQQPNLALTVLKFFTFFPIVAAVPIPLETWIEKAPSHIAILVIGVVALHMALRHRHRAIVRDQCNQLALEDDEEDFPMKLGLRY